jgi:HEAT repeat protein
VWSELNPLGFLVGGTLLLCILLVTFSAIAVVERARNTRRARHLSALEDRWEPAVLEALDGARTPASVRSLVRERDALLFVEYVSRFARRVRGPERDRLAEMVAPWLPRLAHRLTHRDEAIRARAVQTISLLDHGGYAGRLVRALDDRSQLVAMAAARALARRERAEFAAQVLRRLPRFAHWRLSFVSAMLTEMGPNAVPELLAAFADPGQPAEARAIVADALNALHVLEAADIAAGLLGPHRNRDLVAAALRLLRDLGRQEHVAAVRALLTSPDDMIRAGAIAAFGALASPAELELLVPALEDPSHWAALEAARALRLLRNGAELRALAKRDHAHAIIAAEVLAESAS